MWMLIVSVVTTCYIPPVTAPVTDPFVAPACAYCPGQRGNEYAVSARTRVVAGAAGTVTFSGVVAGVRYVVVLDDAGLRATYGRLATAFVAAGDRVAPGATIGLTTDTFYFGLRDRDDTPIDPALHLAVVSQRARLVPTDGGPARPARPGPLRCPRGS